jgi:flagellar protein FliO/FliZ
MILLNASWNSFVQLLGVLIIFLFVLVVTYLTTKFVGGFQKNQLAGRSIQILDTVRLSGNKYISVLKAGTVYLVIAVAKDQVTTLAKLSEEEFGEVAAQLQEADDGTKPLGDSFREILEKMKIERQNN